MRKVYALDRISFKNAQRLFKHDQANTEQYSCI